MAITETRTRPPQFIEDIGVDLAKSGSVNRCTYSIRRTISNITKTWRVGR